MSNHKSAGIEKNQSPLFPSWLKRPIAHSGKQNEVKNHIHSSGLHTVCIEAKCPNRSECYARGVATFLVMGSVCTRNCSFCDINHGIPEPLDPLEPMRIVEAVKQLNLKHVVITSVTRDDLPDGGASFYAEIVSSLRHCLPSVTVELLIPDLQGSQEALNSIIKIHPDILNHNVETVPRLYPKIRPQAEFKRSLELINRASIAGLTTKSGIMVGFGESGDEVIETMKALHDNGCAIVTIGQYLRPSREQIEVTEFVHPDIFDNYAQMGRKIGFKEIFAGPYVRSSYRAEEIMHNIR